MNLPIMSAWGCCLLIMQIVETSVISSTLMTAGIVLLTRWSQVRTTQAQVCGYSAFHRVIAWEEMRVRVTGLHRVQAVTRESLLWEDRRACLLSQVEGDGEGTSVLPCYRGHR